jgi:hypothetical protein
MIPKTTKEGVLIQKDKNIKNNLKRDMERQLFKIKEPWGFCEDPSEKCTMNYCDDNGCQNRKRIIIDHQEDFNPNLLNKTKLKELKQKAKKGVKEMEVIFEEVKEKKL